MGDIGCFYRAFRVWEKKFAVKNFTRDDFRALLASKSQTRFLAGVSCMSISRSKLQKITIYWDIIIWSWPTSHHFQWPFGACHCLTGCMRAPQTEVRKETRPNIMK